jgi:hypothetical protein
MVAAFNAARGIEALQTAMATQPPDKSHRQPAHSSYMSRLDGISPMESPRFISTSMGHLLGRYFPGSALLPRKLR